MDERLAAFRGLVVDVYELAGAARRTSDEMAREIGQTAAQWHIMSVVSRERTTVAGIARRLGRRRQGVQRVVNDLVSEDLISLEPNPDHIRSPLVALTDRGIEVLDELFRRSEVGRAQLLDRAGLSSEDLRIAQKVIRALNDSFDDR